MTGTFVSYKRWGVALFLVLSAVLGVLSMNIPALAACTNPATIPSGFAAPCPVWSPSASSVPQSSTLTLSATPQPGTDYILTTAYVSQGTAWNPYTLVGNNAVPSYSSAQASLTLSSAQLQALSLGTHYTVSWDWLWDATAQCYKGPGLNQCNTGQWRVQSFSITATYAYSQSAYYTYSQAAYTSGCLTSSTAWQNQAITSQTGSFRLTFDATPNMNNMAGIFGLSQNVAAAYTDLGPIIGFDNTGVINARNGGVYQAANTIPYTAGSTYHFRLDITIPTHTYSAYVPPPGQAEKTIGVNYAFRTEQAAVTSLNYLNVISSTGTYMSCNAAVGTYVCSQSSYYAYSQSSYYAYSQGAYYVYSQGTYSGSPLAYYVSTGGSDSNSGSISSPWRSIAHAAVALTLGTYGTDVHVAPGTYNESITMTISGTSQQRIRFISDTPWGAKIMGNGSTAPAVQVRTANYVDVVNFEISNPTGYMGLEMLAIGDRAIGNLVHNVPGGCTLGQLSLGGAGINMAALTTAYDQEATGNYIHDIGDPFNPHGCALTHGIYVEDDIPPAGHFSGKVQNNVIYRVESDGITSWHCISTMIISNNTVFEAGSSGILVGGYDGCTNANSTVDNNIVVHNGYHADCTYTDLTQCPSGKGVHLGNGGILENDGSEANNLFKNNLLYSNQRAGVVNDTILLKAGGGSVQSGTIIGVNPLFVTYTIEADAFPGTRLSSNYLHLQAGSPAINTGAGNVSAYCASSSGFTSCVPTIDFDGVSRPQGSAYDIGAYEFH